MKHPLSLLTSLSLPILIALGPAGCEPSTGAGVYTPLSDAGGTDGAGAAKIERSIGPGGGSIVAGAGPLLGLKLQIPAGALPKTTEIICTQIDAVPKNLYAGTGLAVRCTPNDLTFNKPASLTLPYDDALLPESGGAAALSVLQGAADGQVYVIDELTIDLNAHTVSASVDTLGDFQTAKVAPTTTQG